MPLKKMAEVLHEYVEVQLMQNPLGADKDKKQFTPGWDFYEMKWADIIMVSNINNYGGPYTLEIIKKGHEFGKFVHFDTDDLLTELYEEHRLYGVYKDNKLDEITKVIYHNSHLVTVTQEYFASRIKDFVRGPLAIIRNAIDYNLPCWNAPKVPSKQVRIGWAGGIHHRPDVKVFAGVPNLVNQKVGKENVIWDFYGHPPPNVGKEDEWQKDAWKEYINSFLVGIKKSSGQPNYRVHPALPPDSYGTMYANMDIAIAPLKENEFNKSKCHELGQEILMFDGSIKKVEDIKIGDKLMGPDSTPRTVKQLFRGRDQMIKIIPTKGKSFRVTKNHILRLQRVDNKNYIDIEAKDYDSLPAKHKYRLFRVGVEFEKKNLILNPYFIGIMLGDGSFYNSPTIVTMDKEIEEAFISYTTSCDSRLTVKKYPKIKNGKVGKAYTLQATHGRKGIPKKNIISEYLKSIGLWGIQCQNRYIPFEYKTSSKKDRLELLAGLLDTDGCRETDRFRFYSTSISLIRDVWFLARSVGLNTGEISPRSRITSVFKNSKICYSITISGNIDIIPCKVERKQRKNRTYLKTYAYNPNVTNSVFTTALDVVDDYYGFEIDGDNLYLLGDFTVTHNSDIKCAEAGRYKIPLIATDVGCYRDAIKNGKTGYLIPPNASLNEWVKVLTKVIKDKQHRIELGENLYNSTNHIYDINRTVWDRFNLYLEVFELLKWKFK